MREGRGDHSHKTARGTGASEKRKKKWWGCRGRDLHGIEIKVEHEEKL